MKRCPGCKFPNVDSDVKCFKCGTPLPEETLVEFAPSISDEEGQASSNENLSVESKPEPDPTTPLFDSGSNVINFIRTPTEVPLPISDEEVSATSTIPFPQIPPPPTPAPKTSAPSPKAPARIIPKYKVFNVLSLISKITGVCFGILLILLGVGILLTFPNILGVTALVLCVSSGIITLLLSFTIAAVLGWLGDVECNQRKQTELIHHIYHKLPDQ